MNAKTPRCEGGRSDCVGCASAHLLESCRGGGLLKQTLRLLPWLFGVLTFTLLPASARADESIFGINGCAWSHLGANTEQFDRHVGLKRLAALKKAGATADRFDLWWARVEQEKGKFAWRDYDWVMEQYRQAGIAPTPILCYASAWSADGAAPATNEERELFGRYVFEAVSRYKDVAKTWEIWNEPNGVEFWHPRPNARDYAELLKVAYRAAKRADPSCTIVGCATAGVDVAFIEDVLNYGGGDFMDALSIHPYQGDLGSLSPDQGNLAPAIRGVQTLLAEYGYVKPLFLTEIGHRTTGTAGHTSVSEEQQAAYLVRSYVYAMAGGVERVYWFNLQDWDERWGLVRQDFSEKPALAAYRQMVEQLGGKQPVGVLDLADNVAAFVFAARGQQPTPANATAVVWTIDDRATPVAMPGKRLLRGSTMSRRVAPDHRVDAAAQPTYVSELDEDVLEDLIPLPPPPERAPRRRQFDLPEPKLPAEPAAWHVAETDRRFAVALAAAEPALMDRPVTLAADRAPAEVRDVAAFTALAPDGSPRGVAERDLDGNLVFIATRDIGGVLYFYPRPAGRAGTLRATDALITNDLLTVHFRDRKFASAIELNGVFTSRGEQVGGIFNASYKDSEEGWPRIDGSAELLEHKHQSGLLLTQYRSRVAFGLDRAQYEFTFTLYDGLPSATYVGRWLSPGDGATEPVNLGDSFGDGTVVSGIYAQSTLPASGVGYGRAVMIRPAGHESVTAVMVSPSGRLNTPGWAASAVVGAGLFYETAFPSTVSAEYFWYDAPPPIEPQTVARDHYRAVAFPPRVAVGKIERRE